MEKTLKYESYQEILDMLQSFKQFGIDLGNNLGCEEVNKPISNLMDTYTSILNEIKSKYSYEEFKIISQNTIYVTNFKSLINLLHGIYDAWISIDKVAPLLFVIVHKTIDIIKKILSDNNIDENIFNEVEKDCDIFRKQLIDAEIKNSLIRLIALFIEHITATFKREGIEFPQILREESERVIIATKKKSTEKARTNRQIISSSNREEILKTYNELKEKKPKISKDKAALEITNDTINTKMNLSFRTIRKYLN